MFTLEDGKRKVDLVGSTRRFEYANYPSEYFIPALGATFFVHFPYYFATIMNDDGSYKQSHTHKSLEIRLLIWYTIHSWTFYYKRIELPKKFPEVRRQRIKSGKN